MGIQRASTLYPVNGTTVDSGTGIDIRLLQSSNGGTNDVTQTCTFIHSDDAQNRTWDPATAGVTANQNCQAIQKKGWALRLSDDMTPGDDTNCDAALVTGTVAMSVEATMTKSSSGISLPGTYPVTIRCGLFRYNPSTDTGSILFAGGVATSWNDNVGTNDMGTFKTSTFNVNVSSQVDFAQGEILLLQLGFLIGTIPNPTSGTDTFTMTLRVDSPNTKMTFAANQGIRQMCALSASTVGDGVASSNMALDLSRSATGDGVPTESRAVVASKSFDVVGDGVLSLARAVDLSRSVTGDGVIDASKATEASKAFALEGAGEITRGALLVELPRDVIGDGALDASKAVTASKSFDVVGEGVITEAHPVQAFRSFDLVGVGDNRGSAITIPIDEVPEGDCPECPDCPPTGVRPIFIFDDGIV